MSMAKDSMFRAEQALRVVTAPHSASDTEVVKLALPLVEK